MSVLRKRSLWAFPIAGIVLGSLAVGLTGCGGDNTPGTITSPYTTNVSSPPTIVASQPTSVAAGQGTTVTSPTTNPGATGGVTGVKVVIPPGVLQNANTLAVEVVPTAQGTFAVTKASNPGAVLPTQLAEILFGSVSTDATTGQVVIDPRRPIVFEGNNTITVSLDPKTSSVAKAISDVLSGNANLQVYQNQNGTLTLTNCTASVVVGSDGKPVLDTNGNDQVNITGTCSGDLILTVSSNHAQGGITP
jgi:hypothetical protein